MGGAANVMLAKAGRRIHVFLSQVLLSRRYWLPRGPMWRAVNQCSGQLELYGSQKWPLNRPDGHYINYYPQSLSGGKRRRRLLFNLPPRHAQDDVRIRRQHRVDIPAMRGSDLWASRKAVG